MSDQQGADRRDRGSDAARTQRAPRRRWGKRRITLLLVLLGVLAVAVVYAATQGALPGMVVARLVRNATGGELRYDSARLRSDGSLVVHGMVLQVPGVDGEAGDIIRAERVLVKLDWSRLAQDGVRPTAVEVTRPVLRLSQDHEGKLNAAQLQAMMPSSGPGGATPLPPVVVTDGTIEFGEHNNHRFSLLVRLAVEGSVAPLVGQPGRYEMHLAEVVGQTVTDNAMIKLDGWFDLAKSEGAATLAGLDLHKWTLDTVPVRWRREWRNLGLEGKVSGAEVAYGANSGLEGWINVEGVALSLPVSSDRADRNAPRVRMHEVTGKIQLAQAGQPGSKGELQAALTGKIEDLPCEVNMRCTGLDPETADIECEFISQGFEMRKTWALRPFAPPIVVKRLGQFSGPTATVDARTKVRRIGGAWSYQGSVRFRQGRAAFEQFPYPFFDLAGLVEFDDERVKIVGITGTGLTGAKLLATGQIWPPEEGENVEIRVDVSNAVVDEVLAAAIDGNRELAEQALWRPSEQLLRTLASRSREQAERESVFEAILGEDAARLAAGEHSWRGGLYTALFSEPRHAELLKRGLILSPAQHAQLQVDLAAARAAASEAGAGPGAWAAANRVAELERKLQTPRFGFGGLIDLLTVRVQREKFKSRHFDTDISLKLRDAGMVPEPFPLPILADNLDIRVLEDEIQFSGKGFKGLTGGVADVSGTIDTTDPDRTARVPRMTITSRGLPVDELLIQAIPERMGSAPHPQSEALRTASAPDALRALNLVGTVDCNAEVWQRADGEPGFDVRVGLSDLHAAPASVSHQRPALAVTGLTGELHVTEQLLEIPDMRGLIKPADGSAPAGTLWLMARSEFQSATGGDGAMSAQIDAAGVDLSWPLEDLVASVSRDAATRLARLRDDHQPAGRVDARVTVEPRDGANAADPLRVFVSVRDADGTSFDILGGRLGVQHERGKVGVLIEAGQSSSRASMVFNDCAGRVSFNGIDSGHVTLDGSIGLNEAGRLRPVGSLDLGIQAGLLESNLTRAVVGASIAPGIQSWMASHEVAGRFDATFRLAALNDPSQAAVWSVTGSILPSSFGVTRRGTRVEIASVSGRVEINQNEARFIDLSAATQDWIVHGEGLLSIDPGEQRWKLGVDISGGGAGIDSAMLALLPEAVGQVIGEASIKLDGRYDLTAGRLELAGPTSGAAQDDPLIASGLFQGELRLADLSADVGVALTDVHGLMVIEAKLPEGQTSSQIRLDITASSLRAAGVPLTEAGAVIASGRREGEVLAPVIFGRCAGGSLSGSAWLRNDEEVGGARAYGAKIELGGVHLGELLASIERAKREDEIALGVAESPPGQAAAAQRPVERGMVTANVSIGGFAGQPLLRRGRGALVIDGGDVVGVPLMAPLLEMSNLIPPVGDRLNYMQGTFYVQGPTVFFEELRLQSGVVEVVGRGTMRTPGMELDLTFNSRGRTRVPLWSDLMEGLRNELITTTVKGTLRDPQFGSEALRGTRSLFSELFGSNKPRQPQQERATGQASAPGD